MKTRIVCLPPGRVAPGMTLAAAVTAHDGHALLSAGTVLDSEILDRLSRRSVESVAVYVLDTRDPDTIAKEVRIAQARVESIFRGSSNTVRDVLKTAVLNYRLEKSQ